MSKLNSHRYRQSLYIKGDSHPRSRAEKPLLWNLEQVHSREQQPPIFCASTNAPLCLESPSENLCMLPTFLFTYTPKQRAYDLAASSLFKKSGPEGSSSVFVCLWAEHLQFLPLLLQCITLHTLAWLSDNDVPSKHSVCIMSQCLLFLHYRCEPRKLFKWFFFHWEGWSLGEEMRLKATNQVFKQWRS